MPTKNKGREHKSLHNNADVSMSFHRCTQKYNGLNKRNDQWRPSHMVMDEAEVGKAGQAE